MYACVQGWDAATARECARAYAGIPFDGIAIGGLVPRAGDRTLVLEIVEAVRNEIGDKPLHVLGLGQPELVSELFSCGAQSVDSTSYVKLAADGRRWGSDGLLIKDAAPIERLHLALCNLAIATQAALPLSAAPFFLSVTSSHLDGMPSGE